MPNTKQAVPQVHPVKRVLLVLAGAAVVCIAVVLLLFWMSAGVGVRSGQLIFQPPSMSDGGANRGYRNPISGGFEFPYAPPVSPAPSVRQENSSPAFHAQPVDRKVASRATFSLLVENAERASEQLRDIARRYGGFIESSNIYASPSGRKTGSVTLRLPAESFDKARADIKNLAVKVERETIDAQDVTEQYVDMEARLKNLRAEEEQYITIMKDARNVQDTLTVASYLGSVRQQIEQIEAQLQFLQSQVAMATITVGLTAQEDVEVLGSTWKPFIVTKQALRSLLNELQGYVNAMIYLLFTLPVMILWLGTIGGVGYLVWRIVRRFVRAHLG